ncbi:MAG: TonB-dependent receptor [Acidimicrobiia bacterium]|nr:TonB-dependent receptor [Acidimicrobiia bacterium]
MGGLMSRGVLGVVSAYALSLLMPALASAQSVIAGEVRDASGAVLPGVTVEAASDALIERVRTATTNGSGAYRIVDLRPGIYVVRFSLAGFTTFEQTGVELPAEFTATVNVQMKVGGLEETVTVTSAASTVDVQNAVQITRLDREMLDQIPLGQNIWEMAELIPSINLFNAAGQNAATVGGAGGATQTYMSVRGMGAAQNVVLVDGMSVSGLEANGAVQAYFNADVNQEVSYQTSGSTADRSGGGVTVNMIPREGGNRPSGNFKVNYRPGRWLGQNFTPRLRDMGMMFFGALEYLSDVTISQGGPLKRDRLWFFTSYHQFNTSDLVPDTLRDDGRVGADAQTIQQPMLRLTLQATPRQKISSYVELTNKTRSHDMASQIDPETASTRWRSPNYSTGNIKYTAVFTSRLLLEGGYSFNREYRTVEAQEGVAKTRGTAEWLASGSRTLQTGGAARSTAPGLTVDQEWPARNNAQASLSYVTGSHNIKVGVQYQWGRFYHFTDANADLTQRYASVARAGTEWVFANPVDVIVANTPVASVDRLNRDVGLYAMDSWRMKRLTLNYGLRWEHINAQNDAYQVPAGRFTPARSIPSAKNVPNWFDWAPRFNMAYDVFGNARTAVKFSLNRYNAAAATSLAYAYNTLTLSTRTLPWTDVNGDLIAQGRPVVNADGSYAPCVGYPSATCELDMTALRSTNGTWFGTPADTTPYPGFPRVWSLESNLELQHQVSRRVTVNGGWVHSNDYNLRKTINRFRQDGDYVPVTIFNPIDGTPITVYSLNDLETRARLAQSRASVEYVEPNRRSPYDMLSLEFQARPYSRARAFGGLVATRGDSVNCGSSRADLVVNPNDERFCDTRLVDRPWAKDFRVGVALPLPYAITLGLTYKDNDEGALTTSYAIVPGTGLTATRYPDGAAGSTRRIAGKPAPPCPTQQGCVPGAPVLPNFILPQGATSLTVVLTPPGSLRRERLRQVDIKLSKTLRYRGLSVNPTLDVYNLFNADKIFNYQSLNYANTAGTYLVPNTILLGRVIGFGTMVRW